MTKIPLPSLTGLEPEVIITDDDLREFILNRHIRPGVRAGTHVPLLPRHKIYAFAPSGQGGRFAEQFAQAWRRIPLWVRRRVLAHWRGARTQQSLVSFSPSIEILPTWASRSGGRGLRGDWAITSNIGHKMIFWTKVVAAMPDWAVQDLIAHELSHVYQHAASFEFNDAFECEEDADSLMACWGFSPDAMDRWAADRGISRTIDLSKVNRSTRYRYLRRQAEGGR